MKAYWFAFKPSDWLSSPDVRMMSKAERGVYINLLCLAWESTPTGHLPASPDMVRRLAEMSAAEWQESGEILLKKFPLSACGTYRINPRQAEEVAKQEEKSQINAEAGRRSAEKRAALAAQRKANENPTGVDSNPTGVENTATNGQRKGNKTQTQIQTQEGKPSSSLRSPRGGKPQVEHFDTFWQVYPRKEARASALKAFEKLTPDERAAAAGWARDWFGRRADWIGPRGEDYRPFPATWLNQKRWTDLTEVTITPQPATTHGTAAPNPQRYALVNDEKRNAGFAILASMGL